MFHASAQERANFEHLMDVLHAFHRRLPAASTAPSTSRTRGAEAIAPVENGVRLALGEKLRVQIQFSVEL